MSVCTHNALVEMKDNLMHKEPCWGEKSQTKDMRLFSKEETKLRYYFTQSECSNMFPVVCGTEINTKYGYLTEFEMDYLNFHCSLVRDS